VDGLVGTAEAGEAAVELGCSAAEPGYSTATDQRTCASDDGEPVPAQ
jgi:hypothetical protein